MFIKDNYDFVYLTNTPSFYKLNLCNEIVCTNSLLLVLYGYGSEAVNTVLENNKNLNFDYYFINQGDSNTRNKWYTFFQLIKLMLSIHCKKVIYAGWMAPEYNLYSFFSPKRKNVMVCESSIFESSLKGIKGWVKRRIIGRMSCALPSGKTHAELFRQIGYKGTVHLTGSVGIFYKGERKERTTPNHPLRYIYVGRLIDIKNVALLIEEFNRNGKSLTIVGKGILESELKKQAKSNITFTGFIDNNKLGDVYQAHDVFILPSTSEPWGLVVEEALYWGLPVIVSDKVGSSIDMVKDLHTGCIFQSENINSLHESILSMETNYTAFRNAVWQIDWDERDKNQIRAYTSLIE